MTTFSALRTLISHGPAVALSWVTVTVPAVAATTGVPQAASNLVSLSSGGSSRLTGAWLFGALTSNDVPGGSGSALTSDAEA